MQRVHLGRPQLIRMSARGLGRPSGTPVRQTRNRAQKRNRDLQIHLPAVEITSLGVSNAKNFPPVAGTHPAGRLRRLALVVPFLRFLCCADPVRPIRPRLLTYESSAVALRAPSLRREQREEKGISVGPLDPLINEDIN